MNADNGLLNKLMEMMGFEWCQNFGYGLTSAAVLVLECLAIILVLNWLMKDRETPLFARKKGVELK